MNWGVAQPTYSESPPELHTRSSAHASCVITRVAVRVSLSPKAVRLRVIDSSGDHCRRCHVDSDRRICLVITVATTKLPPS